MLLLQSIRGSSYAIKNPVYFHQAQLLDNSCLMRVVDVYNLYLQESYYLLILNPRLSCMRFPHRRILVF